MRHMLRLSQAEWSLYAARQCASRAAPQQQQQRPAACSGSRCRRASMPARVRQRIRQRQRRGYKSSADVSAAPRDAGEAKPSAPSTSVAIATQRTWTPLPAATASHRRIGSSECVAAQQLPAGFFAFGRLHAKVQLEQAAPHGTRQDECDERSQRQHKQRGIKFTTSNFAKATPLMMTTSLSAAAQRALLPSRGSRQQCCARERSAGRCDTTKACGVRLCHVLAIEQRQRELMQQCSAL